MSHPIPPRPNPDRRAVERFARSRRKAAANRPAVDPNAVFLGEQSAEGGGGWMFLIHRVTRWWIVGR